MHVAATKTCAMTDTQKECIVEDTAGQNIKSLSQTPCDRSYGNSTHEVTCRCNMSVQHFLVCRRGTFVPAECPLNMTHSHPPGEGYSVGVLVEVCGSVLQTLTPFQTKLCDFTLFQTWPLKSRIHNHFQTSRPNGQNRYPQFQTKLFQKPYPLAQHTYRGVLPPPTPGEYNHNCERRPFLYIQISRHSQSVVYNGGSKRSVAWCSVRSSQ